MPTIRKIKRNDLAELGDEFTVLTDAEMASSGLTIADDEVIVVAKPAPSPQPKGEDDGTEVANLRGRLHEVNAEAASRRIALREAGARVTALETENKELLRKQAEMDLAAVKESAKRLFDEHVVEKKYVFASEEATKDLQESVFSAVDWTKQVTKESLAPEIDSALEKKKYLLKTVELPRTGGRSGGDSAQGAIEIDLAEVASSFNLPYKAPTKQEGT